MQENQLQKVEEELHQKISYIQTKLLNIGSCQIGNIFQADIHSVKQTLDILIYLINQIESMQKNTRTQFDQISELRSQLITFQNHNDKLNIQIDRQNQQLKNIETKKEQELQRWNQEMHETQIKYDKILKTLQQSQAREQQYIHDIRKKGYYDVRAYSLQINIFNSNDFIEIYNQILERNLASLQENLKKQIKDNKLLFINGQEIIVKNDHKTNNVDYQIYLNQQNDQNLLLDENIKLRKYIISVNEFIQSQSNLLIKDIQIKRPHQNIKFPTDLKSGMFDMPINHNYEDAIEILYQNFQLFKQMLIDMLQNKDHQTIKSNQNISENHTTLLNNQNLMLEEQSQLISQLQQAQQRKYQQFEQIQNIQ